MTERQGGGFAEWLRRTLLGPYGDTIDRMEDEIARLQRTLADPDALRPLVAEALHREIQDTPAALATALRPMVEELLQVRSHASPPQRARRYWPWLTVATAASAAGILLLSWRGPATMVSAATERAPIATDSSAATILQEKSADVFGLGQTGLRDEDLAHTVRERLNTCEQLSGATLQFSVKDGWVWLRGQATAGGRDAAERALADLGDGVVVVNQLSATDTPLAAAR